MKKQELLDQLKEKGIEVHEDMNKRELQSLLKENESEETVVSENHDGEATNGTTKEGDESEVKNTDSIPQNGKTDVETTNPYNPGTAVSIEADDARTEDEFKFADESNPNQKARKEGQREYDQDGNLRTGGKSYGVSGDNPRVEE